MKSVDIVAQATIESVVSAIHDIPAPVIALKVVQSADSLVTCFVAAIHATT